MPRESCGNRFVVFAVSECPAHFIMFVWLFLRVRGTLNRSDGRSPVVWCPLAQAFPDGRTQPFPFVKHPLKGRVVGNTYENPRMMERRVVSTDELLTQVR